MTALLLLWFVFTACTGGSSELALPEGAVTPTLRAMEATDAARAALAADTLDGVPAAASSAAADLDRAAAAVAGTDAGPASDTLTRGATSARALASARDLAGARREFGALSQALFALAATDPRLQEGWTAFRCPMVDDHFPRWFQRAGAMENPYMGQSMLGCGLPEGWGDPGLLAAELPDDHIHDPDGVAWHTCPMHPSIRAEAPGQCPICGMDLVPVTWSAIDSGEVLVDAIRRQSLGIRTAPVSRGALDPVVEATGVVQVDDRALVEVTVRVDGYVERLWVEQTGLPVRRGQRLLDLYSPELYATQQDLLRAAASGPLGAELATSARRRLELWGLTPAQIDGIVAGGEPLRQVPLLAPASGTVVDKDVVEGARVEAGQRLFRLADLDSVWVEARVFEQHVDRVAQGQAVTVAVPEIPGLSIEGAVDQVLPVLDAQTRAARVRVALANPDQRLKVGMYVTVAITTPTEPALLVPREAILFAGERRVVFVDRGQDRLTPVDVQLGRRGRDLVEVAAGLAEGDQVVVSGNFLVAAESRLQAATGFWAPAAPPSPAPPSPAAEGDRAE